jgi:hypothetical protein
MVASRCYVSPGRMLGLARAWGAYIRMLAAAIAIRQARIAARLHESSGILVR